jgi:hypothetical protein
MEQKTDGKINRHTETDRETKAVYHVKTVKRPGQIRFSSLMTDRQTDIQTEI